NLCQCCQRQRKMRFLFPGNREIQRDGDRHQCQRAGSQQGQEGAGSHRKSADRGGFMRTVRIGSRESRLAVIQSEIVRDYLKGQGLDVEILTMKTTGDIILDRTLDQIGGKGLFVKELDKALAAGKS